ncbi:MAG: hypothetical protein J6J11_01710 [Treponema sp.]|nr:capsid protein [Clostridia bacterium]MBP3607020.1 hypothetical protein [Treponema sp.]
MGIIKDMVRNWLEYNEPDSITIKIDKMTNFEGQAFINDIWYRGEANELHQLYNQIDDKLGNKHFWSSKPSAAMNIRKIHTGLPGLIIDTLADISIDDLSKIDVEKRHEEWEMMDKEIKLKKLLKKAVKKALKTGDGAFKISIDTDISKYPIVEFYDGTRVEFEYERGRVKSITFKTKKILNKKNYMLLEKYDRNGITFSLVNEFGKEEEISNFAELSKYRPVENKAKFMMAVPYMIYESEKYEGRGKSILDGKLDSFDSFDEVWSQWMLALRKGQLKEYIPDDLLPRDPKTGEVLKNNDFDVSFIMTEADMSEGSSNKIQTTQGNIQHEALLSTYITALDQCLTGVISPSTLGIDVKKLDNAEAQREKEKTTLYRRNQIVGSLNEIIIDVINLTFKVYDNSRRKPITETKVTPTFGGYANPSFEAQVETVGKASTSSIMSTEAQVEELWGDSKDEKWKKEEVKRIKEEKGITSMEEPSINQDVDFNDIDTEENPQESEKNAESSKKVAKE